jgi:hypothetical protein
MERNGQHIPALLIQAYHCLSVGDDGWMRVGHDDVRTFQVTVAAAEAWETIGLIRILEIREEARTGRRLIDAVRIRRIR